MAAKYATYRRTSTDMQDGAAQEYALAQAVTARGWPEAEVQSFEDIGVSGAGGVSRPGLNALKKAVVAGQVTQVMVVGLDRLGRSLRDLLLLLDEFSAAGCSVVSLREGVDLGTPAGKLQMQILGALAEFERSLIVSRVRGGIERARAKGTRSGRAIGRPRRDFDVERARAMRAEGRSWRAIAVAMKVPRRTLERVVSKAA